MTKKKKKRISREKYNRNIELWSLFLPLIISIITSATTITVVIIRLSHTISYKPMYKGNSLLDIKGDRW